MLNLNKFILEKLKINSNSKVKNINEDVLVLDADSSKNSTFDLKLFLHVLKNLNEEYKNPPLMISHSNKFFYSLFNKNGYKKNNVVIHIASGTIKFIDISTFDMKEEIQSNTDGAQKILDKFEKRYKKYDKFKFDDHIPYKAQYMYIWYSFKHKVIRIDMSMEKYNKLLKQNYFE